MSQGVREKVPKQGLLKPRLTMTTSSDQTHLDNTGQLNTHQGFFWQPRHAVGATTDLRSPPRALVWHTEAPG